MMLYTKYMNFEKKLQINFKSNFEFKLFKLFFHNAQNVPQKNPCVVIKLLFNYWFTQKGENGWKFQIMDENHLHMDEKWKSNN